MSTKTISPAEVASHNSTDKGMYIIVDDGVYDVTKFVDEHPGGESDRHSAVSGSLIQDNSSDAQCDAHQLY